MGDGHAGKHGGKEHIGAVFAAQRRAGEDDLAAAAPDFESRVHAHAAAVSRFGVEIALIHMRERVNGGVDDDSSGSGEQIFSVKEGESGEDLMRNRPLGAFAGAGQDRYCRDFGTCSACRRNTDNGKRVRDSAAVIQIVRAVVLASDHQSDRLCGVHR